jgi:dTDP-4-amino-4,6-dideoxygalactose transaminase
VGSRPAGVDRAIGGLNRPKCYDSRVVRPARASYLVFGAPQLLEPEIDEVVATLRSAWIGTGPRVHRFEEEFREYVGAEHAIAVHSCTAALHLAMVALGIKPGEEVVVPAMTFASTASAVIHAGGKPVLADVARDTMCLTPEQLTGRLTGRTRAVIPVHFAGRPCDIEGIVGVAAERGLAVIEDCAHAIETLVGGRHAGTFGDFAAFSFYATKNVVTGEGGMVLTPDAERATRIKRLALHGLSADAWKRFSDEGYKHYEVVEPGFKYNMTDLQAALGIHQLARVEENLVRREAIWRRYDQAFAGLAAFLPPPPEPGTRHARHLYTLLVDIDRLDATRDDVLLQLHRQNIGSGVHYRALHLHPYYRDTFGYRPGAFPNAEWISERTISLPLSPGLTDEDVEDVVAAVTRTLRAFERPGGGRPTGTDGSQA